MAFTVKNWQDLPSNATPLSAAALEDLEARLGAYADTVGGSGTDPDAVPKSLYAANGTMVTGGLTAGNPIAVPLGPNGSQPRVNVLTPGGFAWDIGMQVFNVKDYGVTGDGVTNDTPALNTLLLSAAYQGVVFFPKGTYLATTQIQVPSGSFLMGCGFGVSVIKAGPNYTNQGLIVNKDGVNGNRDITMMHLEVDGNKAARITLPIFNPTDGTQVDPNGHPEVMASMIGFHGRHSAEGFGKNINLLHCHTHDSLGFGMGFQYIEESSVLSCSSYDNYRDGITAGNRIRHYSIIGCHIHHNGDDQIAVSSGTSTELGFDNVIANNTIGPHSDEHAGHGIAMYGLQNSVVVGNAIRGGHSRGIVLFGTNTAAPNNILIANNVLTLPGGSNATEGTGIQIGNSSGNSPITDIKISNNIVRSPLTDGIRIVGTAAGNCRWININDNDLIGGTGFGNGHGINVSQYAVDVRMSNNAVREFEGRGIYLSTTGIGRVEISGGRIENCCRVGGGAAIRLGPTADVTVRGVRVLDNQGTQTQTAALDYGTSSQTWVHGNNFRGCSASGTILGIKNGLESDNIDRAGVLRLGDVGTAGVLPL